MRIANDARTNPTFRASRFAVPALIAAACASLALTGCGMQGTSAVAPATVAGASFQGSVHGGQQPVSGASVQLYASNPTAYGAPSFSLLTSPVQSNSGGSFSINGLYTCPSATSQVYVVATGGYATPSAVNPNLAMMAALGNCGNLSPSTNVNINEITTVASVWALAPFMSSATSVGTSPTNVLGLTNAFAAVNKLTNLSSGSSAGTLPAGAVAPVNEVNTLADILAACINSTGGTAGDTSNCGMLFSAATPPGGIAPTDTIGAALSIAKHPQNNVSTLLAMAAPTSPFQPTISSASDFTISIKYGAANLAAPTAAAIDAGGNVWVTNRGNGTTGNGFVSVFAPTGSSAQSVAGLSQPSGVAIDASGNAWITNKSVGTLSQVAPGAVAATTYSPAGLNLPSAISIDGNGVLWITNSGASSVAAVTVNGSTANSTIYTGAGINSPVAVAIDPH